MDIVIVCSVILVATIAVVLSTRERARRDIEAVGEIELPERYDRSCESIDTIKKILTTHKALSHHEIIIHSMSLMLYHHESREKTTLDRLVTTQDADMCEIGREYLQRYVGTDSVLYHFLAGVIETEVENIRLDTQIPYQDKQTIRKLVDVFYFKHLQ